MRLVIVRHGICEGMDAKLINSWNDVKLTTQGDEMMQEVADKLYDSLNGRVDEIYSSYIKRSFESAKILAKKFHLKEIKKDLRINDRHFGFFQGMNRYQARDYETYTSMADEDFDINMVPKGMDENLHIKEVKRYAKLLNKTVEQAEALVPNGESIIQVEKRVIDFLNYLIKEKNNDKTIVIVTHANIFKLIVKQIEKLDYKQLSQIDVKPGTVKSYTLNMFGNSAFNISMG